MSEIIEKTEETRKEAVNRAKEFIGRTPLAVIATTNHSTNSSECALIAFTQNDNLELFFMTFADSRKYVNLQHHPSLSFVIGFGYNTVQYEGIALELKDEGVEEARYAFSRKETPCVPEFLNNPRARFFKVTPKWIRYSDYALCPAEIFEVSFICH